MLESSQLMVQEYDNPKLATYLEHAARAGTPLLVTVSRNAKLVMDFMLLCAT